MLSGSVRVKTMVESSGTAIPATARAPAGGVVRARPGWDRAAIGSPAWVAGPGRGGSEARTSRGADRPAVVERGIGTQVKGVAPAGRVGSPTARQPGPEPRRRIELDQVVEQQGDHLAALHVGRAGRVERGGVGAQVVLEPAGPGAGPRAAGPQSRTHSG